MRKLKIILSFLLCFSFSFLQGQSEYPFDIDSLQKIFSLLKEAERLNKESIQLNSEGKSVKSKEARKESEKAKDETWAILNGNFYERKIISSTDVCYFQKTESWKHEFDLVFRDVKLDNLKIKFKISTKKRSTYQYEKSYTTSDAVLEKYEDLKKDDLFHGEIEIERSWEEYDYILKTISYTNSGIELTIYCKILSLTPISNQDQEENQVE
ncbi:MAG: hypothetical protein FWH53_09855 [Leptospirales bacterium]|nr:hypothetical protein [Leptospirales bacterium]